MDWEVRITLKLTLALKKINEYDIFLLGRKISSVAMILHSSEHELYLCAPGEAKLSRKSIIKDEGIRKFFVTMVKEFLDNTDWSARLDFLATYMAEQVKYRRSNLEFISIS